MLSGIHVICIHLYGQYNIYLIVSNKSFTALEHFALQQSANSHINSQQQQVEEQLQEIPKTPL